MSTTSSYTNVSSDINILNKMDWDFDNIPQFDFDNTINSLDPSNTTTLTTNIQPDEKTLLWICTHCNMVNIDSKQTCAHCECPRPSVQNTSCLYTTELIAVGYCRLECTKYNYTMPLVLSKLCQKFYQQYYKFESITNKTISPPTDCRWGSVPTETLAKSVTKYKSENQKQICLLGSNIFADHDHKNRIMKYFRYLWKIRFRFEIDQKLHLFDTNAKVEIGILTEDIYDPSVTTYSLVFKGNNTGYCVKAAAKQGRQIVGVAAGGDTRKFPTDTYIDVTDGKYCRGIKDKDMVTIQLDLDQKTISFGINYEWYGVGVCIIDDSASNFRNYLWRKPLNTNTRLFVDIKGVRFTAEIVEFIRVFHSNL